MSGVEALFLFSYFFKINISTCKHRIFCMIGKQTRCIVLQSIVAQFYFELCILVVCEHTNFLLVWLVLVWLVLVLVLVHLLPVIVVGTLLNALRVRRRVV